MSVSAFIPETPATTPVCMSLGEWAALPEDVRGEIVNGQLIDEEMPSYLHELVVAWLIWLLRSWAKEQGARVTGSGLKLAVHPARGRLADVTVYLRDAPRPPAVGLVSVPPSIVVEVVTPTPRDERRDRVDKVRDYAAFGVKWYWLVDPALQSFEILELNEAGRYEHAVGLSEGRLDEVPGCAGLVIDLDALWAEVAEARAESDGDG